MTEWREVTIEELAEKIAMGPFGSDIKVETFKPCGVPIISGKHLHETRMRDKGFNFISEEHADKLSNANVFRGDVIFTHAGNIGQVSFIPENSKYERYVISQRQFYLRCNSNVLDYEFIAYYFKSPYGQYQLLANANQTGVPSLAQPVSYLKSIKVLLPPLTEQKAIAEVLSSLDDKIDLLTRQNKTLEDLAQAFFRKWFVEDADEKLKKYPLSELMVIQNGFAFRSRDYQDAGKYKIVTIKNVQDGFIDTSGTTFLNQLPVGMPDYVLLTIGDVLISLTGNVGRVGIVVEDNLLLNQRVAKISPYNPEYLPFLYFYFRNETTREYLINLAHGTAQANLSPIETLKTEVSFSKTLIKKYSELFMPMYQKIIKNKQQIIVLQKLRDTLLPKLISGEVRVKL